MEKCSNLSCKSLSFEQVQNHGAGWEAIAQRCSQMRLPATNFREDLEECSAEVFPIMRIH